MAKEICKISQFRNGQPKYEAPFGSKRISGEGSFETHFDYVVRQIMISSQPNEEAIALRRGRLVYFTEDEYEEIKQRFRKK